MQNLGTSGCRCNVGAVEVIDAEAHLSTGCVLTLALVQREVQECAVGPGDRSMAAADPAIILVVVATLVIREVQVESESILVEPYRTVEGVITRTCGSTT